MSCKALIAKSVWFFIFFFSSFFPSFNLCFVSPVLLHVVRAQEPGRAHFAAWLLKNCRIGMCNTNLSVFNGTCPRYGFLSYLPWLDHTYTYWCIFCTIIFHHFSAVFCDLLYVSLFFFFFFPIFQLFLQHMQKGKQKLLQDLTWLHGHFAANIFKIKLFNIKKRKAILSAFKTCSVLICVSHKIMCL